MPSVKIFLVMTITILILTSCSIGSPTATPIASPTYTLSTTFTDKPTQTPTFTSTPKPPPPGFVIGETPFRFVGGFIPGWYWGQEWWSRTTDEDLIRTARNNGLTVLDVMFPGIEKSLGVYDEQEFAKLDSFLDTASAQNVYVLIEISHGLDLATQTNNPYYDPHGIEGIMTDPRLAQAFKNRIAILINRRNTINHRLYRNDPTILGWMLITEPISAPWNYPKGAPNLTIDQFNSWFSTMGTFIKSQDSNHLVTVGTTGAMMGTLGKDWLNALDVKQLDFAYSEDADLSILNHFGSDADQYPLQLFLLNKPVVMLLSFTSGAWDQKLICHDYNWQAEMLQQEMHRYFEIGETGVIIFHWGSDQYPFLPSFDTCYDYTPSNLPVSQTLRQEAGWFNPMGYPVAPLQFVKIRK